MQYSISQHDHVLGHIFYHGEEAPLGIKPCVGPQLLLVRLQTLDDTWDAKLVVALGTVQRPACQGQNRLECLPWWDIKETKLQPSKSQWYSIKSQLTQWPGSLCRDGMSSYQGRHKPLAPLLSQSFSSAPQPKTETQCILQYTVSTGLLSPLSSSQPMNM